MPPTLVRSKREDGEVQMRRDGMRIAAGPYISDHFTASYMLAFRQLRGIAVQVRVVIAEHTRVIEKVDRVPARFAKEQLRDDAIRHGVNRRAARLHDVDSLVLRLAAHLLEAIEQILRF